MSLIQLTRGWQSFTADVTQRLWPTNGGFEFRIGERSRVVGPQDSEQVIIGTVYEVRSIEESCIIDVKECENTYDLLLEDALLGWEDALDGVIDDITAEATAQAGIATTKAGEASTSADEAAADAVATAADRAAVEAISDTFADLATLQALVTDAESAEAGVVAAQSGAEDARDLAALSAAAAGSYYDTTIAGAISAAEAALSVGDTYFATGDDISTVVLFEIETGPVSTPRWFLSKADATVLPVEAPDYSNPGGMGDRSASIKVYVSSLLINPVSDWTPQRLVDGVESGTGIALASGSPAGKGITIDFGRYARKRIIEVTIYTSSATTQGTWQWRATLNGIDWVNVGSPFVFGGTTQVDTSMAANLSGYRMYQLQNVSGSTFATITIYEFRFKIASVEGDGVADTEDASVPPGGRVLIGIDEDVPTGYRDTGKVLLGDKVIQKDPDILSLVAGGRGHWYDFADAALTTYDGSNQITRVEDKSGNGNYLHQTAGADSPLWGEVLNNVPCADFRADRWMNFRNYPLPLGKAEVFVVYWSDRTNSSDNNYLIFGGSAASANRSIQAMRFQLGNGTLTGNYVNLSNRTMRACAIQHNIIGGSTGSVPYSMTIDGVTRSGTATVNGTRAQASVGADTSGNTPANALIGEIIIVHAELTNAERKRILSYLSLKWRAVQSVSKYHVVLIAGQSNNRGAYGPINLTDDMPDPRIVMLGRPHTGSVESTDGELILAEHPLTNRWRDTATAPPENSVGPGLAYAKALLATLPDDEGVLLVPCAQGSTFVMTQPPLSPDVTWSPSPTGGRSNAPYLDAVARVNRVLSELGSRAELHSAIWHQGESEAAQATMAQATYAAYLDAVLTGFRSAITGASDLPIIVGEIGTFLSAGAYPNASNVNAAIADTPNRLSNVAVASSASLTDGGDGLHVDAASQRTMGARMFTAYGTL